MSQYAGPGRLVADHPRARPAARGLGRRRHRRAPRSPARVDAILEALRAAGHRLVEATAAARRRAARACTTRSCSSSCARRPTAGRAGPYADLVGQDRVVPYLFPTPAMTAGLPARPAGRRARRRRPVRLRHDDAGRPGHLGGGPGGRRLRPRRPPTWWPAGEPAGLRAVPAARATTRRRPGFGGSCYLNNAAVAAEALRGARRSSGSAIVDVDAHQGNGTAAIFYDRADVLYGSVHVDPAAGWFPHVVGLRRRDRRRRRARARPATCRCPRAPATSGWLDGGARARRVGAAAGCDALVVSLGRRRRARRPGEPAAGHRATATARPARCSAATGLPAVVVQEGGYHLPTLGGLVAAYLEGHAAAGD